VWKLSSSRAGCVTPWLGSLGKSIGSTVIINPQLGKNCTDTTPKSTLCISDFIS
jgi:hypothetical protein